MLCRCLLHKGWKVSAMLFSLNFTCILNTMIVVYLDIRNVLIFYLIYTYRYKFDQDELKSAHAACQKKALEAAQEGRNVIVIDNTNIRVWESKHYLRLSGQYQYVPLILEACTPWALDPKELVKRNSHGVTIETLERKVC